MSFHDKHDIDSEKHAGDSAPSVVLQEEDVDLATFHELHAGRLVIDPAYEPLFFNYSPHIQPSDLFTEKPKPSSARFLPPSSSSLAMEPKSYGPNRPIHHAIPRTGLTLARASTSSSSRWPPLFQTLTAA